MLAKLREELRDLGLLLDGKQKDCLELMDDKGIRAYFRCRDSAKLLIDGLSVLESAMYEAKIIL